MSILIKGMEMPTKCTGCPFVRDIGDYTFVGCKLNAGFAINRAFPYRHGDCPLIPVPPHGALMDRDDFFATFPELVDGYKRISDDLVVIPEEEGE